MQISAKRYLTTSARSPLHQTISIIITSDSNANICLESLCRLRLADTKKMFYVSPESDCITCADLIFITSKVFCRSLVQKDAAIESKLTTSSRNTWLVHVCYMRYFQGNEIQKLGHVIESTVRWYITDS